MLSRFVKCRLVEQCVGNLRIGLRASVQNTFRLYSPPSCLLLLVVCGSCCSGGGADDDDGRGDLVMQLEQHVNYLDSLQHGLQVQSKSQRVGKHGSAKQFGVDFLIRAVLLSRRLRQQSQLASTVSQAIALLPPALRDAASRCIEQELQGRRGTFGTFSHPVELHASLPI